MCRHFLPLLCCWAMSKFTGTFVLDLFPQVAVQLYEVFFQVGCIYTDEADLESEVAKAAKNKVK